MLRERATEPEHFDSPARTAEEIAANYRELARVNRLFRLDDPYTRVMSRWLGAKNCRRLTILDLGAGDAWLGAQMEKFAARQRWEWRVTNLDFNPIPLQLNPGSRNIVGSVLALPFAENSFDIVIASQMTHHLVSDAEAVQHFREAWRVARSGVFISDMKRSAFLYVMLWITLRVLRLTPEMRNDGLLSVQRSWTRDELRTLVARAGLSDATVRSYFGTRLIVAARKIQATAAASETSAPYRARNESCSAPPGR
jgi:ubiquinone/menaquinone biosynthesis C-methylase UbiE